MEMFEGPSGLPSRNPGPSAKLQAQNIIQVSPAPDNLIDRLSSDGVVTFPDASAFPTCKQVQFVRMIHFVDRGNPLQTSLKEAAEYIAETASACGANALIINDETLRLKDRYSAPYAIRGALYRLDDKKGESP